MQNTNVAIRTDREIKDKVKSIYAALGMDLTTAVNIFFRQIILHNGIPFEVTLDKPNAETMEAIEEMRRLEANPELCKGYTDVDEMMREILA